MPVKTVSWRQRYEPPYRRPTTSPQMPPRPLIPSDQMTNRMQSLSLIARVPYLLMAQTAKRKVLPANTLRPLRPLRPSSVYTPIVPLLPIESLHTKKTTTVTRKRRAKRTTWSPQLLLLVILSLTQILQVTTVSQQTKALDLPRLAPPKSVTWTVLTTMVRQCVILSLEQL